MICTIISAVVAICLTWLFVSALKKVAIGEDDEKEK